MKKGDLVRLKQPFAPEPGGQQQYQFAVIMALIKAQDVLSESPAFESAIVSLFDPASHTIYTDEFGAQAMFVFQQNEIEPVET